MIDFLPVAFGAQIPAALKLRKWRKAYMSERSFPLCAEFPPNIQTQKIARRALADCVVRSHLRRIFPLLGFRRIHGIVFCGI